MNSIVALPIAGAARANGIVPTLPGRGAASTAKSPDAALHAYAAWLHMERRILCMEIWPHLGTVAEKVVWADNVGFDWHFSGRGGQTWDEGPQPSARAQAVLDLVGVDWRQPREGLGLRHEDNGERPALPTNWPQNTDPLVAMADEAIAAYKRFEECLPDLTAPERTMAEWERRNPRPSMDDFLEEGENQYGVNGTFEYEEWFRRVCDAETEEEHAALRLTDPNRYLKQAQAQYEAAIPKWSARKKVAYRQSGLEWAEAEEARLSGAFAAALKQVRLTRPISLGGLIAKARVAYFTDCNAKDHLAIVRDIVEMFSRDDNKVPDFFLASVSRETA